MTSNESSMYGYSGSSNRPQIHSPALRSFGSCEGSGEWGVGGTKATTRDEGDSEETISQTSYR